MSDSIKNFRKAFLAYVKAPHEKGKLVDAACAIYNEANSKYGNKPDEYIPYIREQIKSAMQGIKLNLSTYNKFNNLIRGLGLSSSPKERQALQALTIASNLINPKKCCLREVINNFLILQNELFREDRIITNRNFAGSFFLNLSDVTNVRGKKSVIDNLLKSVSNEVFNESREEGSKYFPVPYNVNQKIQHIEKHIDSLSETQCNQILSGLIQKISPILHAQSNSDDITDNAESMTNSGKKSALKIHSFNDKWFFTFLAKIAKKIQEVLKIKTTAEHLLEYSVTEAENAGMTLK